MFSRIKISIAFALSLALVLAVPVFAGGWAVITLDELPGDVLAGEPLTVGFMVRQHGRTPMSGLEPIVTANLGNEKVTVLAKAEGKVGHYSATLTFPREGNWNWSIQAFTMDQSMPALTVAAPEVASVNQPVAKHESIESESFSSLWIVRFTALGIGLIGLAVAFLRKSRVAVALTALCVMVGVGSFAAGSAVPAVEAQSKSPVEIQSSTSLSQIDLGKRLFVAKGCVTCHTNSKVSDMVGSITVDEGPNLSNFSADPGYLEKWLFKPSAIKPATKMPDLNLSDAEIEALIAFINSK